jgi:hypothetical protein
MKRAAHRAALFEGGEVLHLLAGCGEQLLRARRLSSAARAKRQMRSRTRFTVGSTRFLYAGSTRFLYTGSTRFLYTGSTRL